MALPLAAAACLAAEPADTVKVIDGARNIVVVREGGNTRLDADFPDADGGKMMHYQYQVDVAYSCAAGEADEFPDDWGMQFPFVRSKEKNSDSRRVKRSVSLMRNASWGWRFNYSGRGNVANGWETGFPDFVAVTWRRRGAEFEIGAGFSVARYNARDGFGYTKAGDRLILVPAAEGYKVDSSLLDLFSFQVPVLYNQSVTRHFSISLGAVVNFNSYARASATLVDFNDNYHKISCKGLQQNLFTVDAYAAFSLYGVGLYARWSPMPVFNGRFGPELKGFSLGIRVSLAD